MALVALTEPHPVYGEGDESCLGHLEAVVVVQVEDVSAHLSARPVTHHRFLTVWPVAVTKQDRGPGVFESGLGGAVYQQGCGKPLLHIDQHPLHDHSLSLPLGHHLRIGRDLLRHRAQGFEHLWESLFVPGPPLRLSLSLKAISRPMFLCHV